MYLAEDYTDYNEFEYFDLREPAESNEAFLLLEVTRCANKLRPHLNLLHTVRTYYDLRKLNKDVLSLLMDFESSRMALLSVDDEIPIDRDLMAIYEDAASDITCTFKGAMLLNGQSFNVPPILTLYDYL